MCSGGALEERSSGERSSGGGELLGRCALEEMCSGGVLWRSSGGRADGMRRIHIYIIFIIFFFR
jgi:hypothetical protein